MKAVGFVILVLLLMLSGCATQTSNPAAGQPMQVQTESAAPADASEEEPQKTGAAGTTENPFRSVSIRMGFFSDDY